MTNKTKDLERLFAPAKQNGIIMRVAYRPDGDFFGIHSPMRELMIAGYAASKGVGPRIFAAYIVPGNTMNECHPPRVYKNPGDYQEQLADPIYRPDLQDPNSEYEAHRSLGPHGFKATSHFGGRRPNAVRNNETRGNKLKQKTAN